MCPQPQVGTFVRYGGTGICQVTRVEDMPFPDAQHVRLCCELKPISNGAMVILVPLDNEMLCAKMRPLLTKKSMEDVLQAVHEQPNIWIEDRKQRSAEFRRMLSMGDASVLLQMLRSIEQQQVILRAMKKKLATADVAVQKEAYRLVEEELVYTLGISNEEADVRIHAAIAEQTA